VTVWNSASVDDAGSVGGLLNDVQIRPNADEVLISHCGITDGCMHALYSLTVGRVIRSLPELTSNRPKFSPEGNWVVSGATLLHLPDGQQRVLDPGAILATSCPTGMSSPYSRTTRSRGTVAPNEGAGSYTALSLRGRSRTPRKRFAGSDEPRGLLLR
jgi:hypothetical protein